MHFPLVSGLPYVVLLCSDPRIPTAFCPEHRNRRAEVGSETLSSYLSAIAPGIFEDLCSSHTQEDAALGNKNTVNTCVHIGEGESGENGGKETGVPSCCLSSPNGA